MHSQYALHCYISTSLHCLEIIYQDEGKLSDAAYIVKVKIGSFCTEKGIIREADNNLRTNLDMFFQFLVNIPTNIEYRRVLQYAQTLKQPTTAQRYAA